MAFVLEDRVVETAANPGQGDFELLGAVENNRTFVAAIGNGNTTRYLAVGAEGWEIGVAEVSAGSPDRLLRPGTVTKNSDGGTSPISFTGSVTVACIASVEDVFNAALLTSGTLPAGRLSGNYSFGSLTLGGRLYLPNVTIDANRLLFFSGGTSGVDFNDSTGSRLAYALYNSNTNALDFGVQDPPGGTIQSRIRIFNDGTLELVADNTSVTGNLSVDGNPVATVSTTGNVNTITFPIGHVIAVYTASTNYDRNASETIRLDDDTVRRYRNDGSGAVLTGTWRSRGRVFDTNSYIFQRVA